MSTKETILAVSDALSAARMSTYENAAGKTGNDDPAALELYSWNAQVSNPRRDLQNSRKHQLTTGKVIPELKFVFWQQMFTSRHDLRVWNGQLVSVLPNMDATKSVPQLRQGIYNDLEELRKLRNRIAHHEPIFRRTLADDMQRIHDLVALRCHVTAAWMMNNQQASAFISRRP
jgi:hypothetical protein